MYRETIEHPESIPEPIKKHLDLTSGRDRGRIYELRPSGGESHAPRRPPRLGTATTEALVQALEHPHAWYRETAQRLLIGRKDPEAVPLLHDLARTSAKPLARVHELWTLGVLGQLTEADVLPALADPEPGVREQAARLGEHLAGRSRAVRDGLLALARDPDPMVRFQAALSMGEVPGAAA